MGMAVYFIEKNPKEICCSEANTIQLNIRDLFLPHFLTDTSEEVPSKGRTYFYFVREVTSAGTQAVLFFHEFSKPLLASPGIVLQIRLRLLPS
jgi:hypothetical protein